MRLFGRRGTWWIYLTMVPGLLVYILFGVVPSIMTTVISLMNYTDIAGVSGYFVGLHNYIRIFNAESIGILASIRDTLIFAVGVTVVQNVLGIAMAAALRDKRMPGFKFFRALVFLPAVLGVTVIGLVWALIFNPAGGPAANVLRDFGITSAFLGSSHWALPIVIGVQIWSSLGFTTVVYLAGMNAITPELYEAVALDGGARSGWQVFRGITFPLMAPSVTVNVLLAAVGSLNVYDLIYVLTDGLYHTNTLGMFMFNTAFQGSGNLGLAAAISVIEFVLTLIVAIPLQRYLRSREVAYS